VSTTLDELQLRIVHLLVFEPERLSRNRNFHAFDGEAMHAARRVATHLRSLRHRLRTLPDHQVSIQRHASTVRVHMVDPGQHLTHEALLPEQQWRVLMNDPELAARFDAPAGQ
jgi:hypothetical protein